MKQDEVLNYQDYKKQIESRNLALFEKLDSTENQSIVFKEDEVSIDLTIYPSVFNPALGEGSRIMSRIKYLFIGDVLEIGTGSGILAILAAEIADKVIATDINPNAIECARENVNNHNLQAKITLIESDLFKKINKTEQFDTILFNPPFLNNRDASKHTAVHEHTKEAYFDKGYSVLESFLKDAKEHLKEEGCIYICFGGVGDVGYLNYLVSFYQYQVQIVRISNIDGLCYFVYELSNG